MGGGSRGFLAGVLCATTLAVVPAAEASQGSDTITRWSSIGYTADPGEVNNILVEPWNFDRQGLHLKDTGAIIRWTSIPGLSNCVGGGHDVWCLGGYGFGLSVRLGDRQDTFVNRTQWPATVYARDGEVDRITCGSADFFDEVYGDTIDVIVNPGACSDVQLG